MRKSVVAGCLWLALAAYGQGEPVTGDTQTVDGHKVELVRPEHGHYRVMLDGKAIYAGESEFFSMKGVYSGDGRAYIVIEENNEGTSCPAKYRVFDISVPTPIVRGDLGNCSDIPKITMNAGKLHLVFPRFQSAGAGGRFYEPDSILGRGAHGDPLVEPEREMVRGMEKD